jgi:hypothetical protein
LTRPAAGASADIERYLLGRMSSRDMVAIERRLFEDDQFALAVEDAEDDLIDRYLRDALSAEDRRAFEEHFAASPLRQERIAFRRVLPQAVAGRATADAVAAARPTPWRALPRWAGLAAVLVLGLWILQRRPGPLPPSPDVSPPITIGGSSPPPSEPAAIDAPDLVLRPGLLRSGGALPRVTFRPAAVVRIDAELEETARARVYAAAVRTVEGRVVWEGTGQPLDRNRIRVVVPASALRPGDYLLRIGVSGHPGPESTEYPFVVAPPAAR